MALTDEQIRALQDEQLGLIDIIRVSRERLELIGKILTGQEIYRDEYLTELDGKLTENQAEIEKRISGKRIVKAPRDAEVIENLELPVDGGEIGGVKTR